MNTKRIAFSMGLLFVLLFTSCGGAAPTQAPTEPRQQDYLPQEPAATVAPAAIEAPAGTYAPSVNEAPAPNNSNFDAPSPKSNDEPPDMFFQNYGVNPLIDTEDRKSTRLNSSHIQKSRMPSSA